MNATGDSERENRTEPAGVPAGRNAGVEPLICLAGVSRTYPRGHVQAMRNVSLEVHRQDYVAITGPSGSGKSTLLYLASGMDLPDSGSVLFEGAQPASPAAWTRLRSTRIGFVFQTFHLIGTLTALENVELPMMGVVHGEGSRKRRAAALMESVGLNARTRHRVADMSGGEAQRVAIARALANSPSVLFADEPTGNLDSHSTEQILSLLEDLREREKLALVMVTHDARIAQRAERRIHLRDGQIMAQEQAGEPA